MEEVARVVRGGVTIPARVRRLLGLEEGTLVGLEVRESAVVIRRARIVADDRASANEPGQTQKLVPEGA